MSEKEKKTCVAASRPAADTFLCRSILSKYGNYGQPFFFVYSILSFFFVPVRFCCCYGQFSIPLLTNVDASIPVVHCTMHLSSGRMLRKGKPGRRRRRILRQPLRHQHEHTDDDLHEVGDRRHRGRGCQQLRVKLIDDSLECAQPIGLRAAELRPRAFLARLSLARTCIPKERETYPEETLAYHREPSDLPPMHFGPVISLGRGGFFFCYTTSPGTNRKKKDLSCTERLAANTFFVPIDNF